MQLNTTRKRRQLIGVCHDCEGVVRPGKKTCVECGEKARLHAQAVRAERKAKGLCLHCAIPCTGYACEKCKVSDEARKSKEVKKLKDLVFQAYGGYVCACCGETEKAFLTVDHINNDGAVHRKQLTSTIYRWLKQNNYPPQFQILCMNCNFGKRITKTICPHKLRVAA